MKLTREHKHVFVLGWSLSLFAFFGTALMVITHWHSEPYIEENEQRQLLRSLQQVIPADRYDNDILNDSITVLAPKFLGSDKPSINYRARKKGEPVALALSLVAPNGYSGPISLLLGIDYSGKVIGVRVVKHRETPGLGDAIEKRRSDWIDIFKHKSLANTGPEMWKVKRDGGAFDQLTGATITPRAIVSAVQRGLQYFQIHRESLFNSMATKKPMFKPNKVQTKDVAKQISAIVID